MQLSAAAELFVVIAAAGGLGVFAMSIYHVRTVNRLHEMVATDPLTGLGNRRGWDLLCTTSAAGEPVAVALLDLDQFKPINDHYGHDVGDLVLQEFARRVRQAVGQDGRVFRLGGDEFVAVIRLGHVTTSAAAAASSLTRAGGIYSTVVGSTWTVPPNTDSGNPPAAGRDQPTIQIRTSVGVTAGDCRCLRGLLGAADRAMYLAKTSGGGVRYVPAAGLVPVAPPKRPPVRRRDRTSPVHARHRVVS